MDHFEVLKQDSHWTRTSKACSQVSANVALSGCSSHHTKLCCGWAEHPKVSFMLRLSEIEPTRESDTGFPDVLSNIFFFCGVIRHHSNTLLTAEKEKILLDSRISSEGFQTLKQLLFLFKDVGTSRSTMSHFVSPS